MQHLTYCKMQDRPERAGKLDANLPLRAATELLTLLPHPLNEVTEMLFRVRGKVNQNGEVSTFNPTIDAESSIAALSTVRKALADQGITDVQITNIRADSAGAGKSVVSLRKSEAKSAPTSGKGKPAAGSKR